MAIFVTAGSVFIGKFIGWLNDDFQWQQIVKDADNGILAMSDSFE